MSAQKTTQPVAAFPRCLSAGLTAALLGCLASVAQAQNADISAPNTILAVAQQSVQQIEAKKAGDLYAQAPAFVKAQIKKNAFVKGIDNERTKLGPVTARQWIGMERVMHAPGNQQPSVACANVRFVALRQNTLAGSELVSLCLEQQQWRTVGYVATPQPAAPAQQP
ncbi:MAG: DUF4019 domain-containing protein [Brachymonas sp.]